jgi:hypothetical protein
VEFNQLLLEAQRLATGNEFVALMVVSSEQGVICGLVVGTMSSEPEVCFHCHGRIKGSIQAPDLCHWSMEIVSLTS